jgi:hypothetical protein
MRGTLVSLVQKGDQWQAKSAARYLVNFHQEHLDENLSIVCDVILATESYSFGTREKIIDKATTSIDYRNKLEMAAKDYQRRSGEASFASLVAAAPDLSTMWTLILEHYLCKGSFFREADDEGHWFIKLARNSGVTGAIIGAAASHLFSKFQDKSGEDRTGIFWLGILANEFGQLPAENLGALLLHNVPEHSAAVAAVLARCSARPNGFTPLHREIASIRARHSPEYDRDAAIEQLCVRVHSQEPSNIDHALGVWAVSEWQLTKEERVNLGNRDNFGPAARILIDWLDDVPSSAEEIVTAIETHFFATTGTQQVYRLLTSSVFRCSLSDPTTRAEAVSLLGARLRYDTYPNPWQLSALFELATKEAIAIVPQLIERLLNVPDALRIVIAPHAVAWTLECSETGHWGILPDVARTSLEELRSRERVQLDPSATALVHLLFPLIFWLHSGKPSILACEVFAQGLLKLFEVPRNQGGAEEVLFVLAPLIERVPAELLRQSVEEAENRAPRSIGVLRRLMGSSAERHDLLDFSER